MRGEITFQSRDELPNGPRCAHLGDSRYANFQFLGTALLVRYDGVCVAIDMYVDFHKTYGGMWIPSVWNDWGEDSIRLSITSISDNIDCTLNQASLHFVRDYVLKNWWQICLREPRFP